MTQRTVYRVMQPWGKDRGRDATLISEHPTAADAFAEIERLARRMRATGARSDAIELVVVDADGRILERPGVRSGSSGGLSTGGPRLALSQFDFDDVRRR